MKSEISKLAKLLRTSEKIVLDLEKKMERVSGKKGIIEKIIQENDKKIKQKLKELDLTLEASAEQVYQALIKKVKENDQSLFKHFRQPNFTTENGCRSLLNATREITGDLSGFYLKESKAKELLKSNPPSQIMASLGYGNDIDKMLDTEDVFEIFAALRFVEDSQWLNDVFFKSYQDLKKEDFKQREIKVTVLPERWLEIGQKFLGKKLHHMSHLKELGLIFIIPVDNQVPGETLYIFFMTLHYIYEVDWHARLFETYSREKDFAKKMIDALKVGAGGMPLPDHDKISWRILPKYLAKNNPNDPRLSEPHINPEAWHYTRAVLAIQNFAERFPDLGLGFWKGLDVVGECFPLDRPEKQILISFDLFDNGISLLQQVGFESKYLYHQQEALWNRVFTEYMGEECLNKSIMENLAKGYITL